jgi:hypothetical protein
MESTKTPQTRAIIGSHILMIRDPSILAGLIDFELEI